MDKVTIFLILCIIAIIAFVYGLYIDKTTTLIIGGVSLLSAIILGNFYIKIMSFKHYGDISQDAFSTARQGISAYKEVNLSKK